MLGGSAVAAARQADHHVFTFHGSVTSSAPSHHWLQIHASGNKVIRFQTRYGTQWDDCDWNELHHGHAVTIHGYKSNGSWIATTIGNWHHSGDD